ncbi:MAG: hypothetical protein ACKVOP_05385 [Sphingomonadaceae bacterium]
MPAIIAKRPSDLVLSPDGSNLYASFDDGELIVFDAVSGGILNRQNLGAPLNGMDITADGKSLFIAQTPNPSSYAFGGLKLYQYDTASTNFTIRTSDNPNANLIASDVAVINENKLLVASSTYPFYSSFDPLFEFSITSGQFVEKTVNFYNGAALETVGDGIVKVEEIGLSDGLTQFYKDGGSIVASTDGFKIPTTFYLDGVSAVHEPTGLIAQHSFYSTSLFYGNLNHLGVIDPANPAAGHVSGLAFSNDGRLLFSINAFTDSLTVYDTRTLVMVSERALGFDVGYPLKNGAEIVVSKSGADTVLFIATDTSVEMVVVALPENSDREITGSYGSDVLWGTADDDILFALAGADAVDAGAGDDLIYPGIGADHVDGGAGNDTVSYSDSFQRVIIDLAQTRGWLSDTLISIENLIGSAFNDGLRGNGVANTLDGGLGNDNLFGFGDNDTLLGGLGNDNLQGGDGNDVLKGGAGRDLLLGGEGDDQFVLDSFTGTPEPDTIRDFAKAEDTIVLDRAAFAALAGDPAGALTAASFHVGPRALTADHHLIYNAATGALFYDADGAGGAAQVLIATMTGRPVLDAGDFVLI